MIFLHKMLYRNGNYNTVKDRNIEKQRIFDNALAAKRRNESAIDLLTDTVSLWDYSDLIRKGEHGKIWTDALQTALCEHEIIIIPPSDEVYWIDKTIVVPSNTRIVATGAVIRLVPEYPFVMMTNEHVHDGTPAPIRSDDRDTNISICGGSWEECSQKRGKRPFHNNTDSFFGVQTCMLFNNIEHLTMTDVTFVGALSFCVQVGDLTDGVFEHFFFISCFADGLHINGNCENLYICNFRGHVGDDLVALNMYDWLGSSINYGPAKNVFCCDIHSARDSKAKAMRLQPGLFKYRDGSIVDCSLKDMYFKNLSGIYEYKLYFQSPPYRFEVGETPEGEGVGSADNLFFENVDVISCRERYPLDDCEETGYFGMFYLNSRIGYISLENIRYVKPEGDSLRNFLVAIGPMSWHRMRNNANTEVFDPYISGDVDTLDLKDIFINGERVQDVNKIVKMIQFNNVNHDGFSSGKGSVRNIYIDGVKVNPADT